MEYKKAIIDIGSNTIRRDAEVELILVLNCKKSWVAEQQEAEKQIKHIENSLGKKIVLHFTDAE
jgi:hypothetical protein